MLKNEIQIFISFLNLLLQNESQILFCLFSLLLLMRFKYFCLFDKMRFNLLFSSINYFKTKLFSFLLVQFVVSKWNSNHLLFIPFVAFNEIQIPFSCSTYYSKMRYNLCACLIDYFKMKFKSFCLLNLSPQMRFKSCLITQFDISKQNSIIFCLLNLLLENDIHFYFFVPFVVSNH
jgi:hypothetical protein